VFRLFSFLPLPVLRVLLGFVAFLLRVFGWRRAVVDAHLGRCLADRPKDVRDGIARDFYRYLGELGAETFHAPRILPAGLERRVRLENPEVVQAILDRGQRVMILSAHHCNWEWLLLRCSTAFHEPMVAAYKPASFGAADRALREMRSRFGATMVPAQQLVTHLLAQRGKARLLALLADQSPAAASEQQTWLTFFGQETAFFRGPGWIAAKMAYSVFFAAMHRERPGYYAVRFVPLAAAGQVADPDQLVAAYAHELEAQVRAHPAEYFWAYKRWKRAKRLYD